MGKFRRSYVELYRNGHDMESDVWFRLMEEGELEEGTSEWREAYAVARETMTRARANVERIVSFLSDSGYHFGFVTDPPSKPTPVWEPPTAETPALIARLIAHAGPIPLAIRAWWEVVGSVSLQGAFPADDGTITPPYSDPLYVSALKDVLAYVSWDGNEEPGVLDIAPDIFHKANVSGGSSYRILAPDRHVDARLHNVIILVTAPPFGPCHQDRIETNETFVEYLRRSFAWAGFPGYAFAFSLGKSTSAEPIRAMHQYAGDLERLAPLFPKMLPL